MKPFQWRSAPFGVEDAQRDVLSNDVLERDRIVLRQKIEVEMEELRNRFRTGEAAQQQHVLAERCRDRDATIVCVCVMCHQFTHVNTASPASVTNSSVFSQPIQPRRGASSPSSSSGSTELPRAQKNLNVERHRLPHQEPVSSTNFAMARPSGRNSRKRVQPERAHANAKSGLLIPDFVADKRALPELVALQFRREVAAVRFLQLVPVADALINLNRYARNNPVEYRAARWRSAAAARSARHRAAGFRPGPAFGRAGRPYPCRSGRTGNA